MEVSDIKQKRGIQLIFLLMYLLTVLWFTVLKRSTGYQVAQLELFWSYRKWFAGDTDLGREILANIAMCVPLGFLLSAVFFLRQSRPDTSTSAWSEEALPFWRLRPDALSPSRCFNCI